MEETLGSRTPLLEVHPSDSGSQKGVLKFCVMGGKQPIRAKDKFGEE